MEEGACAGLVVEHLHTEKFSELLSDNSEAELTGFSCLTTGKKRKRGNLTDVSCSSYSSGAGSPLNLPFSLGFIGKTGFESTDEHSDQSYSSQSKSLSGFPGYQSATTAVVSDSEDEIDFPNDVTDLDTFSVEYEPPETNSEDDNDGNESDDEESVIVIPSSSDEEDPGADGGDEYDINSDNEDSWECSECWTLNYPLTTKCLMCWKERTSLVQQLNRTMSAPETSATSAKDNVLVPALTRSKTCLSSIKIDVSSVTLSRSSSSCSSTTQTSCDSGICVSSCETDTEKTLTTSNGKISCDLTSTSSASNLVLPSELHRETATVVKTTEGSSKENDDDDSMRLCVICSTEPRNASIIHGRSGHQVCCITCAEKLKADKKRCPVCRRRITFVIKNFL